MGMGINRDSDGRISFLPPIMRPRGTSSATPPSTSFVAATLAAALRRIDPPPLCRCLSQVRVHLLLQLAVELIWKSRKFLQTSSNSELNVGNVT